MRNVSFPGVPDSLLAPVVSGCWASAAAGSSKQSNRCFILNKTIAFLFISRFPEGPAVPDVFQDLPMKQLPVRFMNIYPYRPVNYGQLHHLFLESITS